MKKIVLLTLILSAFSLFGAKKEYVGTVEPILDGTFKAGTNFEFMGELAKVPRIGSIVKPALYSIDGKILRPADIIIQSNLMYHAASVVAAQNALLGSRTDLATQLENYTRYKSLDSTGTVSDRTYDLEEAAYFEAKGLYEADNADVAKEKAVLSAMTQTAKFEALVADVYRPIGVIMSEHEVVRLQQLVPIYVHVKMSEAEASKINMGTPVAIYPINSNEEFGVMHGFGVKADDGFNFTIFNKSKYLRNVKINGKTLPLVREVESVIPFNILSQKGISVPKSAILKDNKGQYVWKASGLKNCVPGEGLKNTFNVKKVYVKPTDEVRSFAGYLVYKQLEDNKELAMFDMVLREPPEGLKDGDMVCYMKNDYIFMPGDKVKVVIGE